MSVLAIITARGGSKRIPRKNIKTFMGKPMLSYAIEACKTSGVFDTVMVSTDSNEIASVAKSYGAEVPFMRSAATASDFAITADVLTEVLHKYARTGMFFDQMCCIYPCVPFLTGDRLQKAWTFWNSTNMPALMPVCRYSVPIEWAMKIAPDGCLVPDSPEKQLIRSQDLSPKFYDAGMFYFYETQAFLDSTHGQVNPCAAYELPESEVQDIDTEEDWLIAEMKYQIKKLRFTSNLGQLE